MNREEVIRILGETTLCTPLGQAAFAAIKDVEKQITRRPVVNKYYYFCPVCGSRRSIRQKHNYCHDCGQAFDREY